MAEFRPFKALRPRSDLASKISALPYDVYSSWEARKIVKLNPLSFLRVDRPEICLDKEVDIYSEKVYEKARANLLELIEREELVEDRTKSYYIYRLVMDGRSQTGLVGLASIDDYLEGRLKRHEYTRRDKEEDRTRHVRATGANTGPIFLINRKNDLLSDTLSSITSSSPVLYDFTSEDGVGHSLWKVDDSQAIATITSIMASLDKLYIADGHHRAAAAVNVGLEMRRLKPDYTGEEAFNYFLSVVFSEEEVHIMAYNRLVADLKGLSKKEFLERTSEKFIINKVKYPYKPLEKYYFGMYLPGQWYELIAREETTLSTDILDRLDVSILQDQILKPILGIEDPRSSSRIDFVGGVRGLQELERRVREDMELAFSLYPTGIWELMEVSDRGLVLPPKSTWFEPKLRSGLFIHRLNIGE